jgi:uncharacterized phage-associated protein
VAGNRESACSSLSVEAAKSPLLSRRRDLDRRKLLQIVTVVAANLTYSGLMGAMGTYRGTAAAVLQLLLAARHNGVIINRTKLAKLLYLADLAAVESDLPPGTGVEWRWRHYGPYSNALVDVESDLETAKIIRVTATVNYYGRPEKRLRLRDAEPQIEIDNQFACIIDDVVAKRGNLSASQLRDITYQTAPMISAKAKGMREVRLDLTGGEPYPDLEPALVRLRKVASEMPPLEDEPGGMDDLANDIAAFKDLRRAATSHLLDAE